MTNENYINIQGWMINELNLKGNELVIYAIIYGFTQDGESEYHGSMRYISEALKITKGSVHDCIQKLLGKELIEVSTENSITGNRYKAVQKMNAPVQKMNAPVQKSVRTRSKIGTNNNNTNNNNTNKLEREKKEKTPSQIKAEKERIANAKKLAFEKSENYLRSIPPEDYQALMERYIIEKSQIDSKAEDIILWKGRTGKLVKHHKLTLLTWIKKDFQERKEKIQTSLKPNF